MNKRSHTFAFTVIELLVAIVIILILVILSSVGLQIAINQSRSAVCVGNLHQISLLMNRYLAENRNTYPLSDKKPTPPDQMFHNNFWPETLVKYSGNKDNISLFVCPGVKDVQSNLRKRTASITDFAYVSYGINWYGVSPPENDTPWLHPASQLAIEEPSRLLLLLDFDERAQPKEGWYQAYRYGLEDNWEYITKRHRTVNALFCDGHVQSMSLGELTKEPTTDYPWGEYKYTRDR